MAQAAPFSTVPVAARLANGFLLDLVKLGGFGRDVIDGLLLTAISQANVAQITRSPELQRAYATLDQPPPDTLRRPVSINAVAASLRIPFETARRRVAALAELGVLQVTPTGVILPSAPVTSPFYRMAATGHYELVRELYHRLSGLGLLAETPRAPAAFDPAQPPIRLVVRQSSDYALRLVEPLTEHMGDIVTGLVLMDMVQANVEHLPDTAGGLDDSGPGGFVPDAERRPVRVAKLSQRLGVPKETVRRHVARLMEQDRCVAAEEGYMVPSAVLARPPFVRYMLDNQTHLHRLFNALGEQGVLAAWDASAGRLRGAARPKREQAPPPKWVGPPFPDPAARRN